MSPSPTPATQSTAVAKCYACHAKMVCERWCARLCVKDGVWQSCVWKMVKDGVAKMGEKDGVCVWIIWKDVKLLTCLMILLRWFFFFDVGSNFGFTYFSNNSRGHAAIMQTHANEAMHDGGSRGWSPWCTCFIISTFSNGTWLTQEPPCRFQTTCFQISRFARFSKSESQTSLEDDRAASEPVDPSSKDVERFAFALFLISNHQNRSCQVYWGVFWTYDAFHISNSIRYFWASVSFIPIFVKVVWTLRGKPFQANNWR